MCNCYDMNWGKRKMVGDIIMFRIASYLVSERWECIMAVGRCIVV